MPEKDCRNALLSGTSGAVMADAGIIAPWVGETAHQIAGKKWVVNYIETQGVRREGKTRIERRSRPPSELMSDFSV